MRHQHALVFEKYKLPYDGHQHALVCEQAGLKDGFAGEARNDAPKLKEEPIGGVVALRPPGRSRHYRGMETGDACP